MWHTEKLWEEGVIFRIFNLTLDSNPNTALSLSRPCLLFSQNQSAGSTTDPSAGPSDPSGEINAGGSPISAGSVPLTPPPGPTLTYLQAHTTVMTPEALLPDSAAPPKAASQSGSVLSLAAARVANLHDNTYLPPSSPPLIAEEPEVWPVDGDCWMPHEPMTEPSSTLTLEVASPRSIRTNSEPPSNISWQQHAALVLTPHGLRRDSAAPVESPRKGAFNSLLMESISRQAAKPSNPSSKPSSPLQIPLVCDEVRSVAGLLGG